MAVRYEAIENMQFSRDKESDLRSVLPIVFCFAFINSNNNNTLTLSPQTEQYFCFCLIMICKVQKLHGVCRTATYRGETKPGDDERTAYRKDRNVLGPVILLSHDKTCIEFKVTHEFEDVFLPMNFKPHNCI